MRTWAAALACLGVAACGLSLSGTGAAPSDADASADLDAAFAPLPDRAVVDESAGDGAALDEPAPFDGGSACPAPPAGWTRLAYLGDRNTTCPAGSASLDLIEHPTAGAGACACGACTVTQHQTCTAGDVVNYFDTSSSPTCSSTGLTVSNNPAGGCVNQGPFTLGRHFRGTPPAPTGNGTCDVPALRSRPAVSTTPVRTCAPAIPNDCALITLGDCIAAPGAVACPAGTAYQIQHVVGADFDLVCGTGSCPCTVTTTCKGKLTVSGTNDCGGGTTLDVDDTCRGANSNSYQYTRYVGAIASESCVPGEAPAAALTLTSAQTVCCR